MSIQSTKEVRIEYTNANTHELAEGDEIMYYGVVFKLNNRKEWPMRRDDCPDMQGVGVTFDTELVWHPDFNKSPDDEPYYPLPLSWAKSYGVSGNKLAVWAKITSRGEFK